MELIASPYRLDFIRNKQEELYEMFKRKGKLADPELVKLSQELDSLINTVQQHAAQKKVKSA